MKKIAVFMLFGQSNATGHAMPMDEQDIIKEPLANVFGLNREPNQSFDTEKLKFTGYTSYGMNLAENQDNTYSVANCLAKRWQNAINEGTELPDLYIIHVSIGAQGMYGMWNPDRPRKLIPGKLGDCDISMYPLTMHVLGLFKKYMQDNELEPDFVGAHWRGGEQEFWQGIPQLENRLKPLYIRLINDVRETLGYEVPFVFHRMPFVQVTKNADPTDKCFHSMNYINGIFEELSNEFPAVSVFDVRRAPFYDENAWDYGILRWDLIHYLGKTNDWVASDIFDSYMSVQR